MSIHCCPAQVANPPKGADGSAAGTFTIFPLTGTGLTTNFTITPLNWTGNPTNFSLAYSVVGSTGSSGGGGDRASSVLVADNARLSAAGTLSLQLPAGLAQYGNLVTVQMWARGAGGALSLAAAQANVTVAWPALSGPGAAAAFVGGLAGAATDLAATDPARAQQMVAGLGSLLNGLSAEPNADTAALAAQRLAMLSVIAGTTGRTIKDALGASEMLFWFPHCGQKTTRILYLDECITEIEILTTIAASAPRAPPGVLSTASTLALLTAVPGQLTPAAQQAALSALSLLAGAGGSVSPAAAQAVADALSGISVAATGGDGSASAAMLAKVVGVLESLGASLLSQFSAPGEPPIVISTPVMQMSVALDSPGQSSRLFSAPLSATGSASRFDPLPAGALSAAGGAPVATTFLSLAFNPHGGAAAAGAGGSSGMTRLQFGAGAGGAEVEVANLSRPITFTLPVRLRLLFCMWGDAAWVPLLVYPFVIPSRMRIVKQTL